MIIEAFRALARYAPEAASSLPAVLDLIDLIPLDPPIRILAQTSRLPTERDSCNGHRPPVPHISPITSARRLDRDVGTPRRRSTGSDTARIL